MTSEELLPFAKKWLWAMSDADDDEYIQTIEACLIDLQNAGVGEPDLSDSLIQQAVKLYLKAQAGYEDESPKFEQAYEHLKKALAISYLYREEDSE